MDKKKKVIILPKRTCMDCGKVFDAKIDRETLKILSEDWYYGKIRIGVGMWGKYTLGNPHTKPDGTLNFVRCISRWMELKFRLIDLKRTILHQYEDVELWVCRECVLAEYGTIEKVRSENPSERYTEKLKVPHFSKKDD